MIEVGRLCVKIAGRDAGKHCAIVEVVDKKTVVIEGSTRKRRCNVIHLYPLAEVIDVKNLAKEFETRGFEVFSSKPRKATVKPTRARKVKVKPAKATKKRAPKAEKAEAKEEKKAPAKKAAKKATKKAVKAAPKKEE